jgi:hypothetical protein
LFLPESGKLFKSGYTPVCCNSLPAKGIFVSSLLLSLPFRFFQALLQRAGQFLVWAKNAVYPTASFE